MYKITNLLTGKIYVGKHTHRGHSSLDFYMGSSAMLKHDIAKLGIENFRKEILIETDSADDAYDIEALLVDKMFVERPDTYNERTGGFGGIYTNYRKTSKRYTALGLGSTNLKTLIARYGVKNPAHIPGVAESRVKTSMARYGVKNPALHPIIKAKQLETMVERYGVENPMHNAEIKSKHYETIKAKYDVDNVSQIDGVKDKKRKNALEKYGVDNVMKAPEVREKAKQTLLDVYGVDNARKSPEVSDKIRQTNIERYGGNSPMASKEVVEKSANTCMERYGAKSYSCTSEHRAFIKQRNSGSRMMIRLDTKQVTQVIKESVDKYLEDGWIFWSKRDHMNGLYK